MITEETIKKAYKDYRKCGYKKTYQEYKKAFLEMEKQREQIDKQKNKRLDTLSQAIKKTQKIIFSK